MILVVSSFKDVARCCRCVILLQRSVERTEGNCALAEGADNQAYWGWHAGNLLSQHSANLEFLPVDRYNLGSNEGLWTQTYRLMKDLKDE